MTQQPTQPATNESAAIPPSGKASIMLEPVQNIRNIELLHELLLKTFQNSETVEIDASAITSVDTATLQLLSVLKQEALKTGKKVTIDFPSDKFVENARLLGLSELLDVEQQESGLF